MAKERSERSGQVVKMLRPLVIVMGLKQIAALVLLVGVMILLFVPSFWRAVYPIHYYPAIELEALVMHVNPLLVAAVVRVESHFREDDVSHAGAIGLMQLMPETAQWVAKKIQMPGIKSVDLARPDLNIRLGSWYLSYLLTMYHGNLPEAIAAYNAGPNRVNEWLASKVWSGSEVTAYDIPVRETRHFVMRVLYTLGIFKRFY